MIGYLQGRPLKIEGDSLLLLVQGVGYDLLCSQSTLADAEGKSYLELWVHTHVREDALALYGFAELQEKRLFEKLLTISGIGPKLAITVLSGINAERLVGAIRAGDHATLTRIPGIGKKTAERVVLELKDKLDDMAGVVAADAPASLGGVADDVLSALVNLGYARTPAQKAVEAAAKDASVSGDFEKLFRASMVAVR